MEPFNVLDGLAVPFDLSNVDTDQILPARFMRRPRSEGYQNYLFHDLRFQNDGSQRPEFVLNRPQYRGARVIVAGRNFGGGSSREQAPWALLDYGIRCVIASDFGEIFYLNALKCGVLPVQLSESVCADLRSMLRDRPGTRLRVDLGNQVVISPDGSSHVFAIDSFRKRCLMEGIDAIDLTQSYEVEIDAFEQAYRREFPWLFSSLDNHV